MSEKLRIAIVGLGLVGTSAGLALRRFQDKATVIGHDRDPGAASQAKKMGAVDRTEWNLINAVSGADRIILALPVSEIRDTLAVISKDLKSGCVVMDTADVKGAVMAWAAELLPADAYFIGGHPILLAEELGTAGARADLFERKPFCLTADARTNDTAVRLAADVVEAMGAQPFFLDAVEHDGMVAAVEHLPAVVAGALMAATSNSTSWQDMRKLAGNQFFGSTLLVAGTGKAAAGGIVANRDHVVRWIDTLIAELGAWRQQLADGEEPELAERFESGMLAGRRWLSAASRGVWDEEPSMEIPGAGETLRGMFFGRLRLTPDRQKRKS